VHTGKKTENQWITGMAAFPKFSIRNGAHQPAWVGDFYPVIEYFNLGNGPFVVIITVRKRVDDSFPEYSFRNFPDLVNLSTQIVYNRIKSYQFLQPISET
jgi:hypothetical protein